MAWIYALHLGEGNYRYVGLTRESVQRRLGRHKTSARNGSQLPVHRWMRKHGLGNVMVDVILVVEAAGDMLELLEYCAIAKFRGEGFDLLNLTDGGEGTHGYRIGPEGRKRMSEAKKGRAPAWLSGQDRDSIIAKMSEAAKRNWQRPEYRKTHTERMTGPRSPLYKPELDRTRPGRAIGERNGKSKLTAADIIEIRACTSRTSVLARQYGISWASMNAVRTGKAWSHI